MTIPELQELLDRDANMTLGDLAEAQAEPEMEI